MTAQMKSIDVRAEDDEVMQVAKRLRDHPQFPAALRRYTEGVTQFRAGPRLLNKLISYKARFHVVGYLMYLDADRERYGPYGGATYARLLDVCTRWQHATPRTLKTVLALLKLARLVRVEHTPDDARVKLYRPTDHLFSFVITWLTYALSALDCIDPAGDRVSKMKADFDFVRGYQVRGGRAYVEGESVTDRAPNLKHFFERDGGFPVLAGTMQAYFDDAPSPSRNELARRFSLSKTQVGNIFEDGFVRGFYERDAEGAIVPTPSLIDEYARYASIELAFTAVHFRDPLAAGIPQPASIET